MNNFDIIQELGKGSFGSVWKARNKKTGQIVALKLVKIPNEKVLESLKAEVDMLKKISEPECHPFLTCYYDDFVEGDKLVIVMEYIDGISLEDFALMITDQGKLHKNLIALAKDMKKALDFLHSNMIIHRDIKPENIMITKEGVPKLIDIGLGCYAREICDVNDESLNCCPGSTGTPYFMSPETLLKRQSYYGSDIWSLGATLYESATGRNVYEPKIESIRVLMVMVETEDPPLLKTSNIELNNIVNSMLKKNPLERSIPV